MTPAVATLVLKPGRERPVRQRHPWIFSGAIRQLHGRPAPGDVVTVVDDDGAFLARGYFNPQSQIRCRLLTWDPAVIIDDQFWLARLQRAVAAREALALSPATTAYRLVYAEADGLPGLIVDRYGAFLVIQCLTLGMARRRDLLVAQLAALLQPQGIVERSDVDVRRKEGLAPAAGLRWGEAPPDRLEILENGFRFEVDLQGGQKTGFYLDQRDNRALLHDTAIMDQASVLNVFAYTGAFGVYAAAAGAGAVVSLDSSANALDGARANMAGNGFRRATDAYVQGDAFQVLRQFRDAGRQFEVVILDPPKFAYSQRDVPRAARGYKDLNWLGMRLIRSGGWLATFSCSGLVSAELFQKILFGAAVDAGREVQIWRVMSQSPDHPISLTFPESAYLKGLLCRVW